MFTIPARGTKEYDELVMLMKNDEETKEKEVFDIVDYAGRQPPRTILGKDRLQREFLNAGHRQIQSVNSIETLECLDNVVIELLAMGLRTKQGFTEHLDIYNCAKTLDRMKHCHYGCAKLCVQGIIREMLEENEKE